MTGAEAVAAKRRGQREMPLDWYRRERRRVPFRVRCHGCTTIAELRAFLDGFVSQGGTLTDAHREYADEIERELRGG